jgi:hypothetical protein
MKRFASVALVISLLLSSGCSWFVPGSVKRQVGLMRTDAQTSLVEVQKLSGEEGRLKALQTLQRYNDGIVVVDDYLQGQKATR